MSKLIWDDVGMRKYELGVSKGVLYKATEKEPYGKGVPWNGLTNVTESPEGAEPTDLYADGIKYGSIQSAENYKTTIEAYTYPEEFEECNGGGELVPGVTIGQQKRKAFGFCYRTEQGDDVNEAGDGAYKLHLVYGAKASPSERSHATINDSPEAETMSFEVNTTPVLITGHKPSSKLTINSADFTVEQMTALEDVLYGTADKEARMPLPDEIATLLRTETMTDIN